MKALAVIAGITVGLSGWVVGASALLCVFTRRWQLFVFPFDQWLLAVRWFKAVSWVARVAIIGSAIPPTVVLILSVLTVCNLMWRKEKRPALYGHTGWADTQEMRSGGIGRSEAV